MTYAYHDNRARYFEHQYRVTRDHVIPFVMQSRPLPARPEVLEIGCAEAGVLRAFLEQGARAVGVDRNGRRLARGREFLSAAIAEGQLELLHADASALAGDRRFNQRFDLIVLKDVIEHVADRPGLFALMRGCLRPGGRVFMAFPPWRMPFGGHQQICKSRVLSRLPYFHLLPGVAYRSLLRAFGETPSRIDSLLATRSTGLSIAAFERVVTEAGFSVSGRRLYLFNPMYEYRFGIAPREQSRWLAEQPALRDFVTTCAYYTLSPG